MAEKTKNDEELINILKIIAPGTLFREGLDNILKAKTGALIIIGDTKEVLDLVDGGFRIDEEYTPARLYELAKMDGAIILSKDLTCSSTSDNPLISWINSLSSLTIFSPSFVTVMPGVCISINPCSLKKLISVLTTLSPKFSLFAKIRLPIG